MIDGPRANRLSFDRADALDNVVVDALHLIEGAEHQLNLVYVSELVRNREDQLLAARPVLPRHLFYKTQLVLSCVDEQKNELVYLTRIMVISLRHRGRWAGASGRVGLP